MSISTGDLEWRLVRGLPIFFNNIMIKQPRIEDIDKLGINYYSTMSYIFCIQKEHLPLWDTLQNEFNSKTLFQSLFVQERFYEANNKLDASTSILILLRESLKFFLDIEDIRKIIIDVDNERFIVIDNREFEGKIFEVPIFELNNDNFEEFSELIRLICNLNVLEIEEEKKIKVRKYKDASMQKRYEQLMGQLQTNEDKKKNENSITIADIIGSICTNKNTKYTLYNIDKLTIWQLFYEFNNMFTMENIDMIKSQYNSGNFQFKNPPDINWLKKVKVKLPEDNKIKKRD